MRGGSGTSHGSGEDDSPIINLWPFFSSSCYSGFDGPEGFFAVYANLFSEIYEVDGRDITSDKRNGFFSFGSESSNQSDVFQFYTQWSSFVTQLSFGWEDEYNTLEAPNRLIKRAMEKDNKKKRDVARKKYMETVRALVDFVKKRDPRYTRFEREVRRRREEEEAARARASEARREQKKEQRKASREHMQGQMEQEARLRMEERKSAFLLADLSDEEEVSEVNGGGGRGNEGMLQEDQDEGEGSGGGSEEEEEVAFACDICK